jgi:hypothetical protein
MAKKDTGKVTGLPVTYKIPMPAGGVQMETFIPWELVKRGVRRSIVTPIDSPAEFDAVAESEMKRAKAAQVTPLIRALGLAHHWQDLLDKDKVQSIGEIAQLEGIDVSQARRLLRLVLLTPDLTNGILSGAAGKLKLEVLLRSPISADWGAQIELRPEATSRPK